MSVHSLVPVHVLQKHEQPILRILPALAHHRTTRRTDQASDRNRDVDPWMRLVSAACFHLSPRDVAGLIERPTLRHSGYGADGATYSCKSSSDGRCDRERGGYSEWIADD